MSLAKRFYPLILLMGLSLLGQSQIIPDSIDIVRDKWGVPHIFAETDAEVAYGFAWATAEDDFETMQGQLLPVKGLMGRVYGKEGAIGDVAVHLLGTKELVERKYTTDLSPEFRKVVEAYAEGVNAYAKAFPKEVLHKKLFPITGKEVIQGYVLGVSLMSGVNKSLQAILSERLTPLAKVEATGSNAFAIRNTRTADGQTYLAINSHQPLEGLNSWYEAHLCSEEGWNILGSTFAGGLSIFHGANDYLGWAHTLNYPDLADVYELKMHPSEKLTYSFDGKWEKLSPYFTKAKIKLLGFLPLGLTQKFYQSKYGVTFQTDQGFFALRFPANRDIRAAEQWYRMNKAKNLKEFQACLAMQGLVSTNIVYADREHNIYYLSNGKFPKRKAGYNWEGVVPGDTSATLWSDDYYPLDSLPQVLNPQSGYVYNCNNTPFSSSSAKENPSYREVHHLMGYQKPGMETNRSIRLSHLLEKDEEISYAEFKEIKYDQSYHSPLSSSPKLEPIFSLNPNKYPTISKSIELLQNWDRMADKESEAASIFILALRNIIEQTGRASLRTGDKLTEFVMASAIQNAQNHLLTYFGKMKVPLGELQRHSRGNISLPYGGGPDVLAAVGSTITEEGHLRPRAGDSYIQLVRFSDEGVEIESVNAYGASAKEGSPHYTDQMELFTNQRLKPMTLDKEEVYREAKRVYSPK